MEDEDILFIIAFAIVSAILTYAIWHFWNSGVNFKRFTENNVVDENEPSKRSKRIREKRVSWQADILDIPVGDADCQTESRTISSRDAECEMSMKEKFYLFLDKGFCPELEKGVKDPIHQYYGGKMKHETTDGEEVDVAKLFCPYQSGDASEEQLKAATEPQPEGNKGASLEELINLAKKNGGKCPLTFGQPADQEPEQADKCPFDFGLAKGADSEDEADIPASHGANGECPSMRSEMKKTIEDAKQFIEHVKQEKKDKLNCPILRKRAESTLTPEEMMQEEKAREEQIAAIVKLLATQEDSLSAEDPAELKSQLKMYM